MLPGDIETKVKNDTYQHTLRIIQANKPDTVFLDNQKRVMYIIEFSVPAEANAAWKGGKAD